MILKKTRKKIEKRGYRIVSTREFDEYFCLVLHFEQKKKEKKVKQIFNVRRELNIDQDIFIMPINP